MSTDLFEIFEKVRKIPHERYSISDDWKYITELKGIYSLNGREFRNGDWKGLDLTRLVFDYCHFRYAYLLSCNFSKSRFKGGFHLCKCEETNFDFAKFEITDSSTSIFLNCSFRNAIWERNYWFEECWFENCDLTGLVFEQSWRDYEKTTFKNCVMSEVVAAGLRSLKAIILE